MCDKVSSRIEHNRLEENLRSKKFANDTSAGVPVCRWIYTDIQVDVMPTDYDILGFSNKWYAEGIENKISKTLHDGTEIFVFSPEYYLASKLEAHNDRGGNDLRQSHDFEDIIFIFENCPTILDDIGNSNLTEGIESTLPYGSDSDSTQMIKDIIGSIAEL